MQVWQKFPFVRFTVALVAGILLGNQYLNVRLISIWTYLVPIALLLATLLFVSWYKKSQQLIADRWNTIQGVLGVLILVFFGATLSSVHSELNGKNHLNSRLKKHHSEGFRAVIIEPVQDKPSSIRTVVEVRSVMVDSQMVESNGKLMLTIQKSPATSILKYGDEILVQGNIHEIRTPHNPNVFNAKRFYAHRNIYHEAFVKPDQFKVVGQHIPNWFKFWSYKVRSKLEKLLTKDLEDPREEGIILALVLGIKDDLNNDIKRIYSEVGAMHILAVSGLHVGLVYQVFLWLIGRLRLPNKRSTQVIEGILLLAIIWSYTFITGLSPSVQRAALMFSFIVVGKMLHRETNIYNTICASAFFLLCINPNLIFEVGFQLSYLAVLGIVYLQPKIYVWFEVKWKWLNWIWTLTTVSIAAQVATAPISIFYFHQFPNYFLLSNFVAIPAATGILCLGLLKIAVSWIDLLSEMVGWVLEKLVYLTNEVMIFLDELPGAVTKGIHINSVQMLCLYLAILTVLIFTFKKRLFWFGGSVLCMLVFVGIHFAGWYKNHDEKDLIIYDVYGYTALGLREGHSMIFVNSDSLYLKRKKMQYQIEPHWDHDHIDKISYCSLEADSSDLFAYHIYDNNHLITWNGKTFFLINHPLDPSIHDLPRFDFVILRDNVYLHETFYEFARFRNLIVDSSCTPWYIQHHRAWLEKHSAYVVGEMGYYIQQL